MMVNDPKPLVA